MARGCGSVRNPQDQQALRTLLFEALEVDVLLREGWGDEGAVIAPFSPFPQ